MEPSVKISVGVGRIGLLLHDKHINLVFILLIENLSSLGGGIKTVDIVRTEF